MLEVNFRKTREYDRRNGMKKENGLSNGAEKKIQINGLSNSSRMWIIIQDL